MDFTARQLADALAPTTSEVDRAKAMRRIQHWTSEELLTPIQKHSGRGSVRRYSPTELLGAALLWEMAERNMSIQQMWMVYAEFLFSWGHRAGEPDLFQVALRGSRQVLVLINLSNKSEAAIDLDPVDPKIPVEWTVGLWIDLTATFARLRPHFLELW